MVNEKLPGTVLVDDLRSFVDGRVAHVARSSKAGIEALERHRGERVDELWLDHDLGEDDTIWPVVEVLERAAFEGRPFDVGVVYVHSANPAGAEKILQALRRWGYDVRRRLDHRRSATCPRPISGRPPGHRSVDGR